MSFITNKCQISTNAMHFHLPNNVKCPRYNLSDLDIKILQKRGAFSLPPRSLCNELVEAFFKWVAPVIPVINYRQFMQQYNDPGNPPSLLLFQAILFAGSRVCGNSELEDEDGSTSTAALVFYKKAKALYDANYEKDSVVVVQALTLMGWCCDIPGGKSAMKASDYFKY
jgi:Fungal specific transcription factor domain